MRKLVVVALTGLLMCGGVSAAHAKSKFTVTLTASTAKIELGGSVKLTGKVSPAPKKKSKRRTVAIQRQNAGGAWTTIATVKLSTKGTFSRTVKPTVGGPTRYRVLKAKTSSRSAGLSPTRNVDVWRWVDLVLTPTEFVLGNGASAATSSIRGTAFGHSLEVDSPGASLGWDLTNRRCDAFRAYVGLATGSISNGGEVRVGLFPNSNYFTAEGESIATTTDIQAADDPTYIWRSLAGKSKKRLGITFLGIGAQARGTVAVPAVHCKS